MEPTPEPADDETDDESEETQAAAPVINQDGRRDRQDRAPEVTAYL